MIKNKLLKLQSKQFSMKDDFFMKASLFFAPKNFKPRLLPSFGRLSDEDIKQHSNIDPDWSYNNAIRWTPRFYLQKDISREFMQELKKFRKVDEWEDMHYLALVQLLLTEAVRDTTYEIAYNYKIEEDQMNPFHGLVDILIYNNDKESK